MVEDKLRKWTLCQFDEPGDVFEWDITRLNLTHDENIISGSAKVDSRMFCRTKESSEKDMHIFGDPSIDTMSNVDGTVLCRRLNGKIKLLPTTKEEMERMADYIRSYDVDGWVGGVSKRGEGSEAPHWFPDRGIFDFIDPETGEDLITDDNKKFIAMAIHSYQILEDICLHCSGITNLECNWQKCKRKLVGRILCEFDQTPAIRIKGLCKHSPIDRDFLLIEPAPDEGMDTYNILYIITSILAHMVLLDRSYLKILL